MTLTSVSTDALRARRAAVAADPTLIGLDGVQVVVRDTQAGAERWRWRLELRFIPASPARPDKRAAPARLAAANLRFTVGGKPEPSIRVLDVAPPGRDTAIVDIEADALHGDEAPLVILELVGVSAVDRFFAGAPVRLAPDRGAAVRLTGLPDRPRRRRQPVHDYLVKDYQSFRRSMLERMAFEVPRWSERNPSDLGVTVIEILAYAADYLSYYQDAVATEAYIDTARRRESVRRHARLVDYVLHEGSNARIWAQVDVAPATAGGEVHGSVHLPAASELLTYCHHVPSAMREDDADHQRAEAQHPMVFRTMEPVELFAGHGTIDLYTWGADELVLEKGTTGATLVGHLPGLEPGMVLIFENRHDPRLDSRAEADVRSRQAVRLKRCVLDHDPLTGTDLTRVAWLDGDAFTDPLPVSLVIHGVLHDRLSVAHGNIVLADHGQVTERQLPPAVAGEPYRPGLGRIALTYAEGLPAGLAGQPAARAFDQRPWKALPAIALVEHDSRGEGAVWTPRADLLRSDRFDRHFVVETGDDRRVWLRFGDGHNGRRPPPEVAFKARFRVGHGPDGNVGVNAIRHLVLAPATAVALERAGLSVHQVSNPLPGAGGTPPEATEHARITAPERVERVSAERRCVTADDFAAVAMRNPEVADAVAEVRASGAGPTAIVYVSRTLGRRLDRELRARLETELMPCRLLGYEVEVRPPRFVPLDVAVTLWIEPDAAPAHLLRRLAGSGEPIRLFPPGDLSFGRPVYLSELVARAMVLPAVVDVEPRTFRRWGESGSDSLRSGVIPIGPFEIARLDGDEERPQFGVLRVQVQRVPAANGPEPTAEVHRA